MVFRMMHVKDSLSYQRGKPFDPLRLPVYVQFQGGCPCWPLDLQLKASPEESYLASAEEVLKGIQADFLSCFFFLLWLLDRWWFQLPPNDKWRDMD